jgi:hypothetical protein
VTILGFVRRWFSSPRRRRRTLRVGGALLVLATVITIGIVFRNTAPREESTLRNDPIQVYHAPTPVRLTKTDRTLALKTALKFVNTAVARRHVGDSYELVSRDLRAGISPAVWAKGDEIPVVPYPAVEARVRVDYSYRNELGLKMLLVPPSTSTLNPMTFNMDMKALGSGGKRRWLVSSWTPSGGVSAPVGDSGGGGGVLGGGTSLAPQNAEGLDAPISAVWIIVPIALLGAVALVPIGLGIRSWRENRQALRDYEATKSLDV